MAATKKTAPVKKISPPAKKPYKDNTADTTTPPKASPKDAIDLLVADHLAAGKCFKQYQTLMKKGAPAGQRKAVADKVCGMLTVHTRIEEEIFYPAEEHTETFPKCRRSTMDLVALRAQMQARKAELER